MRSVYGCIYGIWNPDRTKVYVGQTTKTPAERLAGHVAKARAHKGCPKLGAAIRKHGDQMIVEPLDVAECQEDLDFLETFYVCALDAIKHGYNCMSGGGGGKLLDEEAKERRKVGTITGQMAMTEEKRTEWHANNRSANRISHARPDVRARISISVKAALAHPEVWAHMSTASMAYWAREEAAGRVLRPPEERERNRLYMQEYRARKRAEKASQALDQAPLTPSPATATA